MSWFTAWSTGALPEPPDGGAELASSNKPMLVADELEGWERKQLMEQHGIRMSLTLRTREELLPCRGWKPATFTPRGTSNCSKLSAGLAVAILNAAKATPRSREFNLTLQARVDHATSRLRVANRHLRELDRAKMEFISAGSRRLRACTRTTIKGYLSADAGGRRRPAQAAPARSLWTMPIAHPGTWSSSDFRFAQCVAAVGWPVSSSDQATDIDTP